MGSYKSTQPGERAPYLALALDQALALCLQASLFHPVQLPQLARVDWRATKTILFTVTISVMSLAMVDVIYVMVAWSLSMAVTRFSMTSTVSWWMHPLSGFVLALCATP